MDLEDVDFLRSYLDSFPELKENLRCCPPSMYWRGRWRAVLGLRKLSSGLEIRCEGAGTVQLSPKAVISYRRGEQKQRLLTLILDFLGPVRNIEILDKTDRNRHQTEAVLRARLRVGETLMVVMAVYEDESSELSSRLLSALVLCWDRLREVEQIAVFLPDKWSERLVELMPHLTVPVVCYKYRMDTSQIHQIYPTSDHLSKVQSPYVMYPMATEAPKLLADLQAEHPSLDLLFRYGKWELSYRGLPVAWLSGDYVFFDFVEPKRITRLSVLLSHIQEVIRLRRFPPPDADHFCFRFGEERWLESLILQDHRKINPSFTNQIYSQVPTWVGGDRKVLDLLTVTRDGRLAVLELKTQKDLNLLFQGLDYWERVDHHRLRRDFGRAGYFAGKNLAAAPPVLYLICPLFEFHHELVVMRRYLRRDFQVRCIGINSNWKRQLQILRHFEL